nr:reverse transcriptase domain-containing protein [Tanacetum cinerariifolium]
MDEPAVATDSSGVPSAKERSPLDFAYEAEASGRETVAPEMPPPEKVSLTTAPGADQAAETVVVEPPAVRESRKRGSSQGVAVARDPESENVSSPAEVGSSGSVYRPEWGVTNGSLLDTPEACQDLMDHAAPLARQVAMGSQLRLRFEQEAKLLRKSVAQVAHRDQRIQARESEINNLEALLETEAGMKRAAEEKSAGLSQELERMRAQFSELQVSNERLSQQVDALQQQVSGEETLKATFEEYKRQQDQMVKQRCAEMDARLDAMSIYFDEDLYPHMLTAIAGRRWVIGHGLRLATMKCAESLEMRQAFVDVVSAGIAKGMSEGLRHRVEHGQAQLSLESIEAYDPEDAPMDVIMATLYLKSDTGDDAPGTLGPIKKKCYWRMLLRPTLVVPRRRKMPHSIPYSWGWLRPSRQVRWHPCICAHHGPPGSCHFVGGSGHTDGIRRGYLAKEVAAVIEEEGPTWMTELVSYLKEGTLPEDEKKAWKLRLKARQYELMEGILYKRSFLTPWAGEGQVPDSRNGLLHEVDRSKSSGNDYGRTIIPAEIGMPTYRTTVVDMVNNDEELRLNLDLLEERRELAAMSEARSKSKMMKYYNSRVRGVAFKPGDFVYRSNDASHAVPGGKLGPKWEGPYEVTDALGNGAYKLRSMDGTVLPRTWNVANLKRCYL